jgi:NADH-quinone oxidoreductase subunit M
MSFSFLFELNFFILPFFAMSLIALLPQGRIQLLRLSSLILSLIILNMSLVLWIGLINTQLTLKLQYNIMNIIFEYQFDTISVSFLILTSFLTVIALLISWQWLPKFYSIRTYLLLILSIQFISFNFFTTNNLLHFYIFFESVLIPMYFLLGIWGLRPRKIHAAYQFFLYTFAGSLFMLIAIIYIKFSLRSDFSVLINSISLVSLNLSNLEARLIWLCFFLAFAIKVPMVPFHIWLPEAHVEAPTAGSVILAGLLLKYGTFGFYKILILNMFLTTNFFFWLIVLLSLVSIIYGSLITYAQIDFKKIIAYSSVSHMGYVTLGLAIKSPESIVGALLMMLTHGFISSALFYIVGILYERYGTRNIFDYGGLKNVMPLFTFYFFLLTLANLNLPLTAGFVSEFLVLISLGKLSSKFILVIAALGVFTNGIYAIWLFNRVCFGKNLLIKPLKMQYADLDRRENFILFIFIVTILFIGIAPYLFLIALEPINASFLILNA